MTLTLQRQWFIENVEKTFLFLQFQISLSAFGFSNSIHHILQDLTMETELEAVNGRKVRAIEVFAHALRFFREHALKVRPWSVSLFTDGRTTGPQW